MLVGSKSTIWALCTLLLNGILFICSYMHGRKKPPNPKCFRSIRRYVPNFYTMNMTKMLYAGKNCASLSAVELCFPVVSLFQPILVVSVTRLIRVAYGDYKLETIPPGLALPVPYKPATQQKARGPLGPQIPKKKTTKRTEQVASPVKWVTSIQ